MCVIVSILRMLGISIDTTSEGRVSKHIVRSYRGAVGIVSMVS